MKKIIFLFVIIFILYCGFYMSYAVTETVYLNSNKNILEIGEEIEVFAFLENNSVVAFNLALYYDNEKLEYISGPENTNVINNRIIHVWHDETGGDSPKNSQIAKFIFKAKADGIATFSIDGDFYNDKFQLMQTEFKDIDVQITNNEDIKNVNIENIEDIEILANKNAKLETLAIENILLNPPFDANINEYSVEISENIERLNILAVPESEGAKIEIIGNEELKVGNNIIKIEIVAQDGITKKSYKINAYKRNTNEEKLYVKEQEENTKKLEKIYEVQQTNSEIKMTNDVILNTNEAKKDPNSIKIILASVFIALGIVIVSFMIIKKIKKS